MQPPQKKILIVEDDQDLLLVLEHSLKPRYEIYTVRYGSLAFDEIRRLRPHLVLMDVHIPQANGMEICAKVRADRDIHSIPVLFLTGQADAWTRDKAKQSGATGYLLKPISPKDLLQAIVDIIGV